MHSERGREGKTERERASRAPAYKAAETSDSTFRSNLQQTDGGRRVCVSGLGELLAASCDITCERGTDLLQQVCAPSLTRSCVGPQMTDRRQALGRLTYIRTALMNVFAQTITSNHRVSGSVVCPCRNWSRTVDCWFTDCLQLSCGTVRTSYWVTTLRQCICVHLEPRSCSHSSSSGSSDARSTDQQYALFHSRSRYYGSVVWRSVRLPIESLSNGCYSDGWLSRYITNTKVNSAFHPSGVV